MSSQPVEPRGDTPAACLPESGNFHTAIAHLYRGEMHRMATWRQRLDYTTNWAVVLALGMTTFALGAERTPPYILLLGLAAVGMCLVIEARRYQHLHHSLWRLRLLERHYFAIHLIGPCQEDASWRTTLAADLAKPTLTIGLVAAARYRLRRNYLMLLYFITAAWLTKVFIHPGSPTSPGEFYARLAVGDLVPSWFVAVTAGTFVITASWMALTSSTEATVERIAIRPR